MSTDKIFNKIRRWRIKTFSWEYWPSWAIYLPVSLYFLYLSIKARSFFFFSAANPTIETGGMFFESKWDIYKLIPKEYYPATIFIMAGESLDSIQKKMTTAGITFPVIAKPDKGGRGWAVKKIATYEELVTYTSTVPVAFLIQSYINYPVELGVFYYRHPSQNKGVITSVTLKKLLAVTGNGTLTTDELIKRNNRSFLQYDKLKMQNKIDFSYIPSVGEEQILVPYGNHVLGATFINYNHIIDEELTDSIDAISKRIDGFYFGRYDLRCKSIRDLKKGKNFSILELNGAGAEPAHIYEPGYSFFKAQLSIARHFRMMYKAARANNKNGVPYMSFKDFKDKLRQEKEYRSKVTLL